MPQEVTHGDDDDDDDDNNSRDGTMNGRGSGFVELLQKTSLSLKEKKKKENEAEIINKNI